MSSNSEYKKVLIFLKKVKIIMKELYKYTESTKDYRHIFDLTNNEKQEKLKVTMDIIDKHKIDPKYEKDLKDNITILYNIPKYKYDKKNTNLNNALDELKNILEKNEKTKLTKLTKNDLKNYLDICIKLSIKHKLASDKTSIYYLTYNLFKIKNLFNKDIAKLNYENSIETIDKQILSITKLIKK
jgi:hypothetical protein